VAGDPAADDRPPPGGERTGLLELSDTKVYEP